MKKKNSCEVDDFAGGELEKHKGWGRAIRLVCGNRDLGVGVDEGVNGCPDFLVSVCDHREGVGPVEDGARQGQSPHFAGAE